MLDKDALIQPFPTPSDNDYLPQPPTEKQFQDCCNEFLWVSTYVAKGLWRKELTYAKTMSEQIVREEFLKLLVWDTSIQTNFEMSMGKFGKYLESYVEPEIWHRFVQTYVDADYPHIWESLFGMCELFNLLALRVSSHFGYPYDQKEYVEVVVYLKAVKDDSFEKKRSS